MKGMKEGYATHEGCQGEDDPNYSEIERPCGLKDCPGTRIQSFSISKGLIEFKKPPIFPDNFQYNRIYQGPILSFIRGLCMGRVERLVYL